MTFAALNKGQEPSLLVRQRFLSVHTTWSGGLVSSKHSPLSSDGGNGRVNIFLGDWRGKLICDDYSDDKQSFANGVTEIGCTAYTRRKLVCLHVVAKRQIAGQAIELIGQLYQVEREA